MNLQISPEWLLQMAEEEDGCIISVGGLISQLAHQTAEDSGYTFDRRYGYRKRGEGLLSEQELEESYKQLVDRIESHRQLEADKYRGAHI